MGDSVMSLRTKRTFRVAVTIVAALAAACGTSPAPAPPELPSLDVTSWTDKTELFMEHPPLVASPTSARSRRAGRTSR
jgi:hypothetical protein